MWSRKQGNLQLFTGFIFTLVLTSSAFSTGQIRLAGRGSTRCSGRVEVYYRYSWGTVCDDNWDIADAEVVCRQLGCGPAISVVGSARFGEGFGQILLDDVQCSGYESSLTRCSHKGYGRHDCRHSEDAGVICSDSGIRLNGSTSCSGRVEINHSGQWGTVCDNSWDLSDAQVVCRQLSCGSALNATSSAVFGEGTGQIWLDEVNCTGSESSLTDCQHPGFGTHKCKHNEDAGVICSDSVIRLTGSTSCSGRVEINHNGQWGTICDDNWDLSDAQVVCRQLSCGSALSATSSVAFGLGTGQIWLDEVNCTGSESSLTDCQHPGFGTHNCGHNEDAGVVCSANFPKPKISISPAAVVILGQQVSITCSIAAAPLSGTFILQKTSGSFRMNQSSDSNSASFNIPKVSIDHYGEFQCQYEKRMSNQTFSFLSNSVNLTVRLPEPNISISPAEVIWGQQLNITCSVEASPFSGTFILQQTSRSFRMTQSSNSSSATFSISKVTLDHDGEFKCQYEKRMSNQTLTSVYSDFVRLTVNLPKPNISISPAAEVTWGQQVIITCSIAITQFHYGTFTLQKTSGSFRMTQPSFSGSETFNIQKVTLDHDGEFLCQYRSRQIFSSVRSDSVHLTVNLPKPNISISSAEVTWGQQVSITCSMAATTFTSLSGTFILQQTSGSFRMTRSSYSSSATFNIPKVTLDHDGEFKCQFEKRMLSKTFTSLLSNSVRLNDNLPKPSISISSAEVTWGQQVRITCSMAATTFTSLSGTFILQQTSGSFRMTQSSYFSSVTFNIPKVTLDHDGEFKCQFEKRMLSKTFTSPLSNSVHLRVSLESPNISLTSPHAGLVWGPGGAEVTKGYGFSFTCSINPRYPQGDFSLIFSGSNITETRPAVNNSASFNFTAAEFEHQGNYSCVYEVTMTTQRFSSDETEPITLIIKSSSLLLVSSVSSGILLLVLLVSLAVCLGCRRKLCSKRPIPSDQNQMSFQQSNTKDDENDQDDYENIDIVHSVKKLEVDKESTSDDDHDYEDADINLGQVIVGVEDHKAVEQRYEEDESTDDDDDDDDYVNVTEPWKDNMVQHQNR
ncbi:PREDICTED: uncharacterized protein LOC106931575 isoform X2 [Poecilia mexicana]|uniref:uncharacterized protein LOC106931575 isoform X2 n=1 Tax=Poecilia mexicana TaxID=48701 RepID=UPI00072E4F96|nr:PREDICTED: uncharacterized protein LOC106931575 isoform X2 [Poecilia mexicana]